MGVAKKERKYYSYPGSLHRWLSDDETILYQNHIDFGYSNWQSDLGVIYADTGEKVTIDQKYGDYSDFVDYLLDEEEVVSPSEHFITQIKPAEKSSVCYGRGNQDLWAISSLLNLTANLQIKKEKSG